MKLKGTTMEVTEIRTNNLTAAALAVVREARAARAMAVINCRIRVLIAKRN